MGILHNMYFMAIKSIIEYHDWSNSVVEHIFNFQKQCFLIMTNVSNSVVKYLNANCYGIVFYTILANSGIAPLKLFNTILDLVYKDVS